MVTFWEGTDLLALLCVVLSCVFIIFPYGVPGKLWYLMVSIPVRGAVMCFVTFAYVSWSTLGLIVYNDEVGTVKHVKPSSNLY